MVLSFLPRFLARAIQTIFNLAGNEEFQSIEMSTIWKLVQTCLIPILTYGAETWVATKAEIKQAQKIMDNCTKRILRTPITTPSEIIAAETGIWDIEIQVAKKQISYYHKIRTIENPDSQLYKSAMEPKNPCMEEERRENHPRTKHINRQTTIKKKATNQEISNK